MRKDKLIYNITGELKLLDIDRGKIKFKTGDSLYDLINNISELDIIIQNPDSETLEDWSYIKWTTCLSDFKKRKFKCAGVGYNENNGYINEIIFEEY